jgi:glycosyltransferase involved in cell wall biosynthesis
MISVCLASYNGELYIREQLNSILSQLDVDDEIIISDDSSNDGTIKVIQSYDDPRIILLESMPETKKLGVVKNFERAIRHASGDYIFLSDQDDIWLEGKVSSAIDALQNNLLVVTDCRVVDLHLQEINKSFFQLRCSGKGVIKNILRNSYLGCCMAFKKEL